jgi:Putative Actinobacterial Holin-X, holin superfamily III
MAAIEPGNDLSVDRRSHNSEAQWPELVSRAVNDLSRIVHAEFRLAELGIKNLIEQEVDRSLKVVIALGFLLCAAICAVSAAIVGLHALLGLWWAAFAIVAAASGLAGVGFFLWARRRPESALSISS